jgi:hypothetical protein
MGFSIERVARELNLSWDMDDLKKVFMSLSLEKNPLTTGDRNWHG